MKFGLPLTLLMLSLSAAPVWATVAVTSPSNNATVSTSVPVVATSSTTCAKGVASSGVYVDNSLVFVVNGTSINTTINLTPGKHSVVAQEWDYCGGASTASPLTVTAQSAGSTGITISSPANNASVGNPVQIVASATSGCSKGIAAMGVYVNNALVYKSNGASLNAPVSMGVGKQSVVVQEWDNCGGSTTSPLSLNVTGTVLSNIHLNPGWNQWGQLPPKYDICDAPCQGVTWSMAQATTDVTTSGKSAKFAVGGTTAYSDALFSNPVLGQGNKMGLTDSNHTLLPTLHNFILDTDVYITNLNVTQDLEFDINWFGNSIGMEWGTECNHLNGNVWDYWDNVNAKWIHTSIPCTMTNGWNHVTLQVHRDSKNNLIYDSVAVNGKTYPMNITVPPFTVPSGWWGMTINFQLDGNYKQDAYTAYLDKTNFTYW